MSEAYAPAAAFVRWFRDSTPYIHAHRGRTFVVSFGGEVLVDGLFANLVHDFALLNSLGVRLVLAYGIRPQVETRLKAKGEVIRYEQGLRVTDAAAMACVTEAAGAVRVEIEALLSMGLANSPMANARIRVASGNFVVAKPLGVRDGVDFGLTGEVRRIDVDGIRQQLGLGNVVLISPLGFSPTGEVFNLAAEEIAKAVAVAIRADKLLLLTERDCLLREEATPVRQLTAAEAAQRLDCGDVSDADGAAHLRAAVDACFGGVERVHLVNRHQDGAILLELFTRDGIGTLISAIAFETFRQATINDVGGILELIAPLEADGTLVRRSRERLEIDIDDFSVIERDGMIIGCAALHAFVEDAVAELACVALHPDYRGDRRGARLLEQVEEKARRMGLLRLFVLTTRTTHWFRENGFEPGAIGELPMKRQALYNYQRKSKVLFKVL